MGAIFKVPGYILYFLGGIWGLIICMGIVHSKLGLLGVLAGLFIFPAVMYLAPWYAGLVDSNWKPLLVVYGSGAVAILLVALGSAIDKN